MNIMTKQNKTDFKTRLQYWSIRNIWLLFYIDLCMTVGILFFFGNLIDLCIKDSSYILQSVAIGILYILVLIISYHLTEISTTGNDAITSDLKSAVENKDNNIFYHDKKLAITELKPVDMTFDLLHNSKAETNGWLTANGSLIVRTEDGQKIRFNYIDRDQYIYINNRYTNVDKPAIKYQLICLKNRTINNTKMNNYLKWQIKHYGYNKFVLATITRPNNWQKVA